MTLFAITLGLSNIAVSRLAHLWETYFFQRLPAKLRRQFAEFESLLDPSRNHRPYRALVAKYWATTEVLLALPQKRVTTLRKFIKIAMYAKENRDLMTLFAITLGLSNIAVSRLAHLWERLPAKLRRQFAEFESLLDPSRNHRPYRALVAKVFYFLENH
ncbi:RasGEF domain protein [Cooperia oncophora]